MTSTRLPGKVLKRVLEKTLLEILLERLRSSEQADQIIVATTTNVIDNSIVTLCREMKIPFFRGSEDDVLSRYYFAAKEFESDPVIRITSDCPIIDPKVVDQVIAYYKINYPKYDYVANCLRRTYPRGMDTEIFSFHALENAFLEATAQPDREHVTPYIKRNTRQFRHANIRYHKDYSAHRWTVDTIEDFELIKLIVEGLYPITPIFSLEDCLALLNEHPEWSKINKDVRQKKYGE